MEATIDLRYPIGKYEAQPFNVALKQEWLADIRFLPEALEAAIINLDEAQIETPYREGGWTIRQVVHHVADSHMNAFCRFKLGLTEENPAIRPYEEKRWAELQDSQLPVNISLTLLHALHRRWIAVLESINDDQWDRTIFHPEHKKTMTLWFLLGMYAWHGRHHAAHINTLRQRMGW
jgi:hypothetical protein